ncbi:hypothetical protein POTOM_005972 [Populus tomentosa]|uniref:Uncharacterized protein n=1 Tax=Populus tomentosa TaxID=118781 RepID=A0A8X8ANE7_POPTO|nr:hypothetical protein POTOM_005972 [Populus tomentosa]
MIVFLKSYATATQALGSLVNKLDLKTSETEYSGDCTFEEAMDISFGKNLSSSDHVHAGRSGLLMWRARDINRQAKDGGLKIWQN